MINASRAAIIYVKSVTQAELIHASSRDIDSIFKVHMCNTIQSSKSMKAMKAFKDSTKNFATNEDSHSSLPGDSSLDPDTRKRINQLKSYISIEEKFAQGARAILKASTTENQRVTATNQLENFKKNIVEWQDELDTLLNDNDPLNVSIKDKVYLHALTRRLGAVWVQ
jgi:predicted RND superfamily exporter protein